MSDLQQPVRDEAPAGGGAIPFQFEDVRLMAKKILQNAATQAKRKIMVAEAHAKEIEKAGYDDGYKKGESEGRAKGEKDGHAAGDKAARNEFAQSVGDTPSVLQQVLHYLEQRKVAIHAEAEADLLALALEIARRIVRHELSVDPRHIAPIVHEAIGLANDRSDLVVHLNPADLSVIEEELPALRSAFTDLGKVHLLADDSMERGGVRVVGREGEIDMRLEEQFAALERALIGELDEGKGEAAGEDGPPESPPPPAQSVEAAPSVGDSIASVPPGAEVSPDAVGGELGEESPPSQDSSEKDESDETDAELPS